MAHGDVLFEFNSDEPVGDLNRASSWSFPLVFSIWSKREQTTVLDICSSCWGGREKEADKKERRGLSRKHGRAMRWDPFPPSLLELSVNWPTCDRHTSGRWFQTRVLQEKGHFPRTVLTRSTQSSYGSHCTLEGSNPEMFSAAPLRMLQPGKVGTGFGTGHTRSGVWASLLLNGIPWTSFSASLISTQSRIKYLPFLALTKIRWGEMCQVPGTELILSKWRLRSFST